MENSAIHKWLFFSLVVLIQACNTNQDCVCPEYYAPVCGSNNKTYENACMAECDEVDYFDGECPVYGLGVVKYYDTLQNGCGYMIEILNQKYKPVELPDEFRIDELFVTMKYRRLNEYYTCENPQGHFRKIILFEIQSYK